MANVKGKDGSAHKPQVRLKMEADLQPDERAQLQRARAQVGAYRSHYECVAEYLRYCDLLVALGMKPGGYKPSVHRVQQELGIPCWRTVKRCLDRALAARQRAGNYPQASGGAPSVAARRDPSPFVR